MGLVMVLAGGALIVAHDWLDNAAAVVGAGAVAFAVTFAGCWCVGEWRLRRQCARYRAEDERRAGEQRQALDAARARRALPAPALPPLRPGAFVVDAEVHR